MINNTSSRSVAPGCEVRWEGEDSRDIPWEQCRKATVEIGGKEGLWLVKAKYGVLTGVGMLYMT